MLLIIISIATTLALFAFVTIIGLVTKLAETKTVTITIFGGVSAVAAKFLYSLTDSLSKETLGKSEATDAILLAITLTLGVIALIVVFLVDKYYKDGNE